MDAEGIFLAWAFTFFFYQMKKSKKPNGIFVPKFGTYIHHMLKPMRVYQIYSFAECAVVRVCNPLNR